MHASSPGPKIAKDTAIPIFYDLIHHNADNSDQDPKAVLDKKRWRYKVKHSKNKDGCSSTPPSKREAKPSNANPAPPFMAGPVVRSHHEDHNATHLCSSRTSKGPDVVSLTEGGFCDMEKKQVWPLCSKEVLSGCFDVDANKMRPGPRGRMDLEGRRIPYKSYHEEIKWGGAG
ncbi:uncharacterized protein BDZ99DRAFT_84836 [Mytilinidion resinicola]|uniref:Uncharacterized protein n=1 Tax=Mytilinidion resinicola TaxID=574789 RepID=A0A6A6YDZ9_9PEZI|nr:uncharacterized protein BDZ99DRAFT_84836 [Mytilinidion resinicola]KAF2806753.1 hypothetical protein BDZ99DRAFT_84836 [Mytilinidion resinicola]